MLNGLPLLCLAFGALITSVAAMLTLRIGRSSNYVIVPAIGLGFLYQGLADGGTGLGPALAGFTVGFGLLLPPWLLGHGGMPDIKLLAVLGVWLGPTPMLVAFAGTIVLLAVATLAGIRLDRVWDAARTGGLATPAPWRTPWDRSISVGTPPSAVPFSVALALSTWTVLVVAILPTLP